MLIRENVEVNYTNLFDNYGLGTTIWSPLAGGLLTGKYNDGSIPDGTRVNDPSLPPTVRQLYLGYFSEEKKPKTVATLQGLGAIAAELGISQAQLAIAWTIKNKDVSTAITGATSINQVVDNLGSLDALNKLDDSVLRRIEEVLNNRPSQPIDFRKWAPRPNRR